MLFALVHSLLIKETTITDHSFPLSSTVPGNPQLGGTRAQPNEGPERLARRAKRRQEGRWNMEGPEP